MSNKPKIKIVMVTKEEALADLENRQNLVKIEISEALKKYQLDIKPIVVYSEEGLKAIDTFVNLKEYNIKDEKATKAKSNKSTKAKPAKGNKKGSK